MHLTEQTRSQIDVSVCNRGGLDRYPTLAHIVLSARGMGKRRELYPIIACALGITSWGCAAEQGEDPIATGLSDTMDSSMGGTSGSGSASESESDSDSGGTGGSDPSASSGGPGSDSDSDTNGSDSDTATTGSPGDTGNGGSCDLDMDVAIRLTLDVSWSAGLAVLEGSGQIDIWLLGHLTPDGTEIALSGQVCDLMLPDFSTGLLAGNETYGTEFPGAIWSAPSMPTIDAIATVSASEPGATLHLQKGAVILGGDMTDPLNDPWPASWSGVNAVDHDGDGSPGVTAMAKTGGDYSYPRIDVLNSDARAEAIYIASRTIMEFDGAIDACDAASGSATVTMENHAVGCRQVGGSPCSSGQTDTLDGNMPQFMVMGGQFDLVRLPDGAACGDVLAELP